LEDRRGAGEAVAGWAAELWWDSHGIPPRTEKAALGRGLFYFLSTIIRIPSPAINPAKIL
jgi:hypothetical protein